MITGEGTMVTIGLALAIASLDGSDGLYVEAVSRNINISR